MRSDISFEINLRNDCPQILVDAAQFETALLNLVNARDAAPEGGRVAVSTSVTSLQAAEIGVPAGRYVLVSVQDNGEGMASEVISRAIEPDILTMTREMFRTLGFEVLLANTGDEALEVLQRSPGIHLMLTDVVMPGMDGIQLAKRAQDIVSEIKIILSSGYISPGMESENLSGYYFLPKPCRTMDVVRTLREIGA